MKLKAGLGGRGQRQLILIILLGLIGAWTYANLVLLPQVRQLSSLGQQIRTDRQELRTLQQIVANEQRIREQHEQLARTVTSLRSLLPSERELPTVIEHLSMLAVRARLKIETISPQLDPMERAGAGSKDKPGGDQLIYRTIPIQIDARAGYHEIGTFLSLVETGSVPIEVAILKIVENPEDSRHHQMMLVLNAFFAVVQEPAG